MSDIIFDRKGTPSLKIASNSYLISCIHNIYAGFIEKDRVHDFNGTQRGWFHDGVLRDLNGKCVGFMETANGKCHPVFPSTRALQNVVEPLNPPLKPGFQEQSFNQPPFQEEWADKDPTTLMIP